MDNCCNTIEDIERQCGGGISPGTTSKILIGSSCQVVCWPECVESTDPGADPYTIYGAFFVNSYSEWNFRKKSGSYVAEPIGDPDDPSGWDTKIEFFVSKLTPFLTNIFNGMAGGDYWAIVTDKGGRKRFLGDEICGGLSISVREQTNDRNGYVVTLSMSSSYLPWYVDSSSFQFVEVPVPVITQ